MYLCNLLSTKNLYSFPPKSTKKIIDLRHGNQTYGDVIAKSIKALEEKQKRINLLCIGDADLDEHDLETELAEADFDSNFVSLEDSMKRYEKEHKFA